MNDLGAGIILVTGIMASGKSTVAQLLAERLPKSVHLRGDVFRRMVVNGRVAMAENPSGDAIVQLRLRYELACASACRYAESGFTVIYQDVILGVWLEEVVSMLAAQDVFVVVLCPSADVVAQREESREKTGYHGFTPSSLDAVLRQETPKVGLWVDNSSQSPGETVDYILANIEAAHPGEAG